MSSAEIEHARQEWRAGDRRLAEHAGEGVRYERLLEHVDLVLAELRRRVGQTFTLAQLVRAYDGADAWSRETIEERAPYPGWARTVALVTDAAFHLYARGAQDYSP